MTTTQTSTSRPMGWIVVTWIATLVTITINTLANIIPFNGITTGEISDKFPSFFVPAGYVFSIWGLIYFGLILWTIFQTLKPYASHPLVVKLRPLYLVTAIANSLWIFGWHWGVLPLTVLLMVILLVTLIMIYQNIQKDQVRKTSVGRWMLAIPFSLYLGWICVATIANVADQLVDLGWQGEPLSGQTWAAFLMIIATGIVGLLSWKNRDVVPSLVLIWALIGIVMKFPAEPIILWVGWIMTGVLVVLGLVRLMSRSESSPSR